MADVTGTRYNKLTAVRFSHHKEYPRKDSKATKKVPYWVFRCDCGNEVTLSLDSVKAGSSMSCGCWRKEASRVNSTVHGEAGSERTKLYGVWAGMKRRCDLPTSTAYPDYGGRGISVCPEWSESFPAFRAWAEANGYTEGLSIERNDNDGNYEPGNCSWETRKRQANNRRTSRTVHYNGRDYTIAELSDMSGIGPATLTYRLDNGWSVERAVNTPIQGR